MAKHSQYDVPPDRFIEVWETSSNVEEVSRRLGMPIPIVHARASTYRGMKIKLKKMSRRNRKALDVDSLNRLIEDIGRRKAMPSAGHDGPKAVLSEELSKIHTT